MLLQYIGAGRKIVQAAKIILKQFHRSEEFPVSTGASSVVEQRCEEFRRIPELLRVLANLVTVLVVHLRQRLPALLYPFAQLVERARCKITSARYVSGRILPAPEPFYQAEHQGP